jgi:hypothetical protein
MELPIFSFDVQDSMKPATEKDSLPRDYGYHKTS